MIDQTLKDNYYGFYTSDIIFDPKNYKEPFKGVKLI